MVRLVPVELASVVNMTVSDTVCIQNVCVRFRGIKNEPFFPPGAKLNLSLHRQEHVITPLKMLSLHDLTRNHVKHVKLSSGQFVLSTYQRIFTR